MVTKTYQPAASTTVVDGYDRCGWRGSRWPTGRSVRSGPTFNWSISADSDSTASLLSSRVLGRPSIGHLAVGVGITNHWIFKGLPRIMKYNEGF